MKKWESSPLTAAGKGLANFSTYSASASAWFSFPLKIICTAPWGRKKRSRLYATSHRKREKLKINGVFVPWHPWRRPQLRARRSSHLPSSVWSSSRRRLLHKPGTHTHKHSESHVFYLWTQFTTRVLQVEVNAWWLIYNTSFDASSALSAAASQWTSTSAEIYSMMAFTVKQLQEVLRLTLTPTLSLVYSNIRF